MGLDVGEGQSQEHDEWLEDELRGVRAGLEQLDDLFVNGVADADGLDNVIHNGALRLKARTCVGLGCLSSYKKKKYWGFAFFSPGFSFLEF